ncbi:MAG: hypothetical protein ACYCT1_02190 [Steroidobacteraceae bacterium]
MKGRELATVLAALRYWQQDIEANDAPPISGEFFADCEPLTSEEIDRLCERLNRQPAEPLMLGSELQEQPAAGPVPAAGQVPSPGPARYLYRPLLRPAGFATMPAGLKWDYVEAAQEIAHLRPTLPVSRHRYGVIACDRKLTPEECQRFDLKRVEESQSHETHLAALRPFVSQSQWEAMSDLADTGEERQFFREKAREFAERIAVMSRTYDQDGKGDHATVHLHYFHGGSEWYITEKDMEGDGTRQAFGYAVLNGDEQNAELGYIDIGELTACGVELDLHFSACTLSEVKAHRERAAESAPEIADGVEEDMGESR